MGYLEVFLTLVVVGLIVGTILALTNVINIPGITPNNTADLEYNKLQNLLNKNNTESEPEEPEPEEPEPEEPIVPTSNVPPPPVAPTPALTYNTHGNNGGVPGNQFCGGAWGGGKMCKYGINNATGTPIACDAVLTAGNYSFQCDGPATYNTPGNNGSVDGNQYCGGVWGGGKMCKYGKNADTGTLVTCNQGLGAGLFSFQCDGPATYNTPGNNGTVIGTDFCRKIGKLCKYGKNASTGTSVACDAALVAGGNYSFQCDGAATYNTPGNNGSALGKDFCQGAGKLCKDGINIVTGSPVTCDQGLAAGNYSFQCEGVYTNNALHWPRIENEICSIGTDCLGYVAGQPTLACDRGKCVYQKKDWSGFYYAPSECKGSGHSQAGTC